MMEEVGPHDSVHDGYAAAGAASGHGLVAPTPSRAAFLSTSTADFHPPDWAAMPNEANMHARFEAFRDSRHCATYMIATKLVSVFGRDQESCDHVLGNPSVSRKHAAVVHDSAGGIYLVDLMSRHGTFVKGKKIPPHDPFLLHEGDIVKFGQSVRLYILKGATTEGASAPVKKSWGRVKLKAPKISAVLPKLPARSKYAAAAVKLVNDICYGNMTDEKLDAFITAVMELGDDEKKDVADLLVEKVHAKFEFYAAHVHKNAYATTVALLKRNMLVEEFEANLAIITQLSQQRHDSIYRANARKILQFLAAVRLDPDNVHSPIMNAYAVGDADAPPSEDELNACPPTTNHMGARERVLSDEGKKLFLAGHGYAPPMAKGHGTAMKPPAAGAGGGGSDHELPHHTRQGSYGSTQYGDDDDDTASQASSYQPPAPWQNGSYNPPYRQPPVYSNDHHNNGHDAGTGGYQPRESHEPTSSSTFGFVAQSASASAASSATHKHQTPASAFGFISNAEPDDENDDDGASAGRPSATGFDFIANSHAAPRGPPPPRVRAEDFLVEDVAVDKDEFDVMWESTNDSEEWAVELVGDFDLQEFQACLERSRITFLSSDKISGMQQLLFWAEQQSKSTIFLVEVMLMPGHSEMTVTFKWIDNSLLYENGHVYFIELFKYLVDPFCEAVQDEAGDAAATRSSSRSTSSNTMASYNTTRPTMHHFGAQETRSVASADDVHTTDAADDDDDDDDGDLIPVLDYLTENPTIEPAKFEQLWVGASVIGSVAATLESIPDKDAVIAVFHEHRLGCLASGAVQNVIKFFFYGEMLELQSLFCVEVVIDETSGAVSGTIKKFAFQARSPEEEQQIDASFVDFLDRIVRAL